MYVGVQELIVRQERTTLPSSPYSSVGLSSSRASSSVGECLTYAAKWIGKGIVRFNSVKEEGEESLSSWSWEYERVIAW